MSEHRWKFWPDFGKGAFGWRADKKAASKLRAALKEIERVGKTDAELARAGALDLLTRLWPAIQQVNRAAGELVHLRVQRGRKQIVIPVILGKIVEQKAV